MSRMRTLFPTRLALATALVVCVAAPALLVALQIHALPRFSPIDEPQHLDYVERASRAELPRQGETLLPTTLHDLACRGIYFGTKLPSCDAPALRPDDFPGDGSQYEAHQPPPYYVLAVPLRWVAQHGAGIDGRLSATRAANVPWLVAGLLLAWAAGRVMGTEPTPLAAALLLLACAPVVIYESSIVSNDAAAVAAGAGVALVAALAHRSGSTSWWAALFAAGFAAAALKASNDVAVVAIAAAFAVAAVSERAPREPWTTTLRRWLPRGGALLLGAAVATVAWSLAHRSLAVIDLKDEPAFAALRASPHGVGVIVREATPLLDPLTGGYVSPETLGRDAVRATSAVVRWLVIGAALAGLFASPRRWPHVVGLIALPALFLGGVALGLSLSLSYGMDPVLQPRHTLSLAPVLALVLAGAVTGRWPTRVLAGCAAVVFGTTLVVLLGQA